MSKRSILGYSDRLSVAPGERIQFMVSCEGINKYQADIVRLIHGDTNPDGPGFKEEFIETSVSKEYPARKQVIYSGSYVLVPDHTLLRKVESVSLQAMIWPTTPDKGVQGLLTKWSSVRNMGYGLFIDENGCVAFWLGDEDGRIEKVSTGKPLWAKCWYFVGATLDVKSGHICVYQEPIVDATNSKISLANPIENTTALIEHSTLIRSATDNGAPLIMAGYLEQVESGRMIVSGHYNGKIDRPILSSCVLTRSEMESLLVKGSGNDVIGAWDFAVGITARGIPSSKVIDKSLNMLHGETINLPARAMTGYNWKSQEHNFIHAPEQYGAIHFHDDDLDDARWEVDFEFTVPDNLKSGLYAARLHSGSEEDYIPFYVRPKRGSATARIAFLAPTASYMAYSNDHLATNAALVELLLGRTPVMHKQDIYLAEHRELGLSTYDTHSDGSGVCYSSRLRPILNMKPKYRHYLSPSLWQFNADLHLIDWLSEMGYEFDVITDQDLHTEGFEILKSYKVVLTGSHPEYYSENMLDALIAYQQAGGRFMYMGGNGFYWVTAYHPENPNVIEVRRWGGTQAWRSQPGEYNLSFTGELGGLWRNRGRAPQKIAGTGFIAEGTDICSYYRRQPDSFNPKAAWIFQGVGEEELIGNFGLVGGGAAGLEIDIHDIELGTPAHALVLASSEEHTNTYWEAVEEVFSNMPGLGGVENPRVRADMIYYTTQNSGAVFSVSSIAWCGSLSHNNYDNNVSQITNNVLKRFMSDEPLPSTLHS